MADKEETQKRAQRIRRQIKKVSSGRPRLSVHRTSKNIYVQIIDDARATRWLPPRRWRRTSRAA